MQIIDIKGNHWQSVFMLGCQDMQVGQGRDLLPEQVQEMMFAGLDFVNTHFFLKGDAHGGFDGLQESWRAAILPGFDIIDVFIFTPGICPIYSAAAWIVGDFLMVVRHQANACKLWFGVMQNSPRVTTSPSYGDRDKRDAFQWSLLVS